MFLQATDRWEPARNRSRRSRFSTFPDAFLPAIPGQGFPREFSELQLRRAIEIGPHDRPVVVAGVAHVRRACHWRSSDTSRC
jgi:hypothetical protein